MKFGTNDLQVMLYQIYSGFCDVWNTLPAETYSFHARRPIAAYQLVCEHDISKSCGWIQTKFGGQVGCVTGQTDSILVKIRIQIPLREIFNL